MVVYSTCSLGGPTSSSRFSFTSLIKATEHMHSLPGYNGDPVNLDFLFWTSARVALKPTLDAISHSTRFAGPMVLPAKGVRKKMVGREWTSDSG